jgi:hypothetical protein
MALTISKSMYTSPVYERNEQSSPNPYPLVYKGREEVEASTAYTPGPGCHWLIIEKGYVIQ